MELLAKVLALCILGLLAAGFLSEHGGEFVQPLLLALLGVGGYLLFVPVQELAKTAEKLFFAAGLSGELFAPLVKVMAIAVVVRIGAALCRDTSQGALAAVLEIGGTVCALQAATPLMEGVLNLMEGWF